MAYRTSVGTDSVAVSVASEAITVPTGVVSTDTLYILCLTATTTGSGHTATGFTADTNVNGFVLGTSGKATILKGTGHVAGDSVTVTNPASGITVTLMVALDNTTAQDVQGTAATSGTASTAVAPALTTSQANEYVGAFFFGLKSTALTFSSVNVGTSRASKAGGGNVRFPCVAYCDQTVVTQGSSGTVTGTFSATAALGSTAALISATAVVVVTVVGIGWGIVLN